MKVGYKKIIRRRMMGNVVTRNLLRLYYKLVLCLKQSESTGVSYYHGKSLLTYALDNQCVFKKIREASVRKVVVEEKIIPYDGENEKYGYVPTYPVYIAELKSAIITGENESIIIENMYLNDRIDNNPRISIDIACAPKYFLASDATQHHVFLKDVIVDKEIEHGINLVGRWPSHIWHLSFEILSRLYLVDQYEEYRNYPLIIDESVFEDSRNIELINMMNIYNHDIIKIPAGENWKVNHLICPSQTSTQLFGYYDNINLDGVIKNKDAIYLFPDFGTINYIRSLVLKNKNYTKRRLFVVRRDKRLENEKEIADYFINLGFEIYNPEDLSFEQEVECFASAEYIIGTIGGALTNCIYCNDNATIGIIMPKDLTDAMFNPELSRHIGFTTYVMDAEIISGGGQVPDTKFYYSIDKCKVVAEELGLIKGENEL